MSPQAKDDWASVLSGIRTILTGVIAAVCIATYNKMDALDKMANRHEQILIQANLDINNLQSSFRDHISDANTIYQGLDLRIKRLEIHDQIAP